MIFVDTSFLVSLSLDTNPNYKEAHRTFRHLPGEEQCISEDILREALTILSQRHGRRKCIDLYNTFLEKFTIIPVTPDYFRSGLQLFLNPKLQKDISLVDCTTAAICKELHIRRILSFDPHFRIFGLKVLP